MTEKPQRLKVKVLAALTGIRGCRIEMAVPAAVAGVRPRRATGEKTAAAPRGAEDSGIGTLRRWARVMLDDQ